jgi:hypothetical protein
VPIVLSCRSVANASFKGWGNHPRIARRASGESRTELATFDHASAKSAGDDVRFVSPDGMVLKHEVETRDPVGGSLLWLMLPSFWRGARSELPSKAQLRQHIAS